ncbi:MAG: hypothetical protein V7K53_21220 [Nostoc sp.]|uniref:hypothetical protein n=1 Tax=Nostoc sp. TaxID=1180 RepID=UPI002FF9BB0D
MPGILYDAQGQDTYQGISNLQGSGTFGSGLPIMKAAIAILSTGTVKAMALLKEWGCY